MGIPSRRPRMGHEARTFFSILAGSGTRRYKIGAIAVPHLIEQPCLEAEGVPVLAREFQVNDFPNIQISIGLETDASFADVGAGPILRNLIQRSEEHTSELQSLRH